MAEPFVTSVQVETLGNHDHVHVFVRGQNVGGLICGKGDGERLQNVLLSEKYFGTGREPEGAITDHEKLAWRVMATNWLDVETIHTAERGGVGRMVLRLLDRITELEDEQERPTHPPGLPSDYSGPSLLDLVLQKKQALFVDDVPWFVKDFDVLYRSAKALAEACHGRGDGRPYPPLLALDVQLARLEVPAAQCEMVRKTAVQRPSGRPR